MGLFAEQPRQRALAGPHFLPPPRQRGRMVQLAAKGIAHLAHAPVAGENDMAQHAGRQAGQLVAQQRQNQRLTFRRHGLFQTGCNQGMQ